jgi:hypothetical protein
MKNHQNQIKEESSSAFKARHSNDTFVLLLNRFVLSPGFIGLPWK